jgi:steroid delta-isomerase-like uncharacterized protein
VQFIEDVVATPEQKRELIMQLTDTFVSILGDVVRPFVYTLIQETPQGEWGIAGVPMPDLVYLTGEKHAGVIERSNDLMRGAIAQMAAAAGTATSGSANQQADDVWRGTADKAAPSILSAAERKAIVVRMLEETNKGNLDVLQEVLADDFVSYGGAGLPDTYGPQGLIDLVETFQDALPDLQFNIHKIAADDDNLVTARIIQTATHKGNFMGLAPATGKKIEWAGTATHRFNDEGKIAERWVDMDSLSLFQQLGIVPSFAPSAG